MKKHAKAPADMPEQRITAPSGEAAPVKPQRDALLGLLIAANAVLFFTMLVLCGIYLNLRINGSASTLPQIPASDRWILTGSGSDLQSGAKSLLSPSFIGFKSADGTQTAVTFDTSSRKNLQKELESVLNALLSGEIRRADLQTDADKRAFAADLCSAERYLFCSFSASFRRRRLCRPFVQAASRRLMKIFLSAICFCCRMKTTTPMPFSWMTATTRCFYTRGKRSHTPATSFRHIMA